MSLLAAMVLVPSLPQLAEWLILEGGEVQATFILSDGRRCQLLITDQQLTATEAAGLAAAAGLLAPRPGPASFQVT